MLNEVKVRGASFARSMARRIQANPKRHHRSKWRARNKWSPLKPQIELVHFPFDAHTHIYTHKHHRPTTIYIYINPIVDQFFALDFVTSRSLLSISISAIPNIAAESIQISQIMANVKFTDFDHGPYRRRSGKSNLCPLYHYLHIRRDGNAIVRQELHR